MWDGKWNREKKRIVGTDNMPRQKEKLKRPRKPVKLFDKDGYPTDSALKNLENFDGTIQEYLEAVRVLWNWPDRYCLRGKRVLKLYLSTGGWSGNESVIQAMQGSMFWYSFWQKSQRGGHYWFRIQLKWAGDFREWGKIGK